MCGNHDYPRAPIEIDPRPPSPTVGPLTPSVDEEVRSSPSFDYHQERRLQLKDEIWLSHHLPRLPPKTDDDGNPAVPKAGLATSPGRSRQTPKDIMIGVSQALDPSPSAFHPGNTEMELGNVQRGWRSMSMNEDDEEGQQEDHRHGGLRDMLSPNMSPQETMIHRTELDDQERLDLEEEAREREISGQGFSGAQTSGQPAAVQPGEYPFFFVPLLSSFHHHSLGYLVELGLANVRSNWSERPSSHLLRAERLAILCGSQLSHLLVSRSISNVYLGRPQITDVQPSSTLSHTTNLHAYHERPK